MPLGDDCGVTINKNSWGTAATPFSNKVSVEILDRNFFQMAFTDKQAIVTPLSKDHCANSYWSILFMPQNQSLDILAHFYQKLQKTAKIKIGFLVTKMDVILSHKWDF